MGITVDVLYENKDTERKRKGWWTVGDSSPELATLTYCFITIIFCKFSSW
jgi:hypothetical protein